MDGILNGMKTTIDAAGRVVIPKQIRQRAGLAPGMRLNIHWSDGRIEIEAEPAPVRLMQRGRLLVAVAEGNGAPLTASQVEEIRERLHDERGRAC